jgi:hypothetical protein
MTWQPIRQTQIIQQMQSDHGINPFALYCSITGEEIGQLNLAQTTLIWASLNDSDSDEIIIDELWARVISSMRPSPAWNYIKHETIDRLRIAAPLQVCCYLLGRYYMPRDRAYTPLARSFEDKVFDGMNRIKVAQQMSAMDLTDEQLDKFIGALLLLDSHFGLDRIKLPLALSPFDLDISSPDEIIEALEKRYSDLVHEKLKLEKQARLHMTHFADGGNRLVRHAAMKHSIEIRPKSEAVSKREQTKTQVTEMTNLLASLMRGSGPAIQIVQSIPTPIRFGLTLNQLNKG